MLFIVLVLRSFLVEPFQIPFGLDEPDSGSGRFHPANKFSYGIRLPVIDKKVIEVGDPTAWRCERRSATQRPERQLIKRVVGLPGDQVRATPATSAYMNLPVDRRATVGAEPGTLGSAELYKEMVKPST